MKKRILAVLLCLSLAAVFAACGSEKDSSSESSSEAETSTEAETTEEEMIEGETDTVSFEDGKITTSDYTIEVGDGWEMTTGSDAIIFLNSTSDSEEGSSANISIMRSDQYVNQTVDEVLSSLESDYSSMESYTITSTDTQEVNGHDAAIFTLDADISGTTAKIKQAAVVSDDATIILTFTALESFYNDTIDEIDEMINSINVN